MYRTMCLICSYGYLSHDFTMFLFDIPDGLFFFDILDVFLWHTRLFLLQDSCHMTIIMIII